MLPVIALFSRLALPRLVPTRTSCLSPFGPFSTTAISSYPARLTVSSCRALSLWPSFGWKSKSKSLNKDMVELQEDLQYVFQPHPQSLRYGRTKVFFVIVIGIYLGAWLAHEMVIWMDNHLQMVEGKDKDRLYYYS